MEGEGGRGRKEEKSGVKEEVVPGVKEEDEPDCIGGVNVMALMVLLSSRL